jgi:uncharacterized oxidoreductase
MRLRGNTIFITGGGSGIGLALGEAFAQRGNQVIAAGRNTEKLKVAERNGLPTVPVDMSDATSMLVARSFQHGYRSSCARQCNRD